MADIKPSEFSQIEAEVLKLWQTEKTFQKSLDNRKDAPYFSFYDGPPFANGLPHFGHSLVTSIKDALGRYKTMRGFYVERRNGWDCHGLPVEYAIEKEFGISGKKQILEMGIDKFNDACRASVFKYRGEWEEFYHRIGRWTDTEQAYATMDTSYTESVWWAVSQVHKKGLLYKGFKSMPYCPRCATPLSNFELNEGYKDGVKDPSLYVKFKLEGEDRSLLAWTTTPWSLAGNASIALNPKETYVTVEVKDDNGEKEQLILAKKRLEVLDEGYKVIKTEKASDLVGKRYEPLFEVNPKRLDGFKDVYKVWVADAVDIEDGTGVLHVAPAYGEDDLALGEKHHLPILHNVDDSGHMRAGFGHDEQAGVFFKTADKELIEKLTEKGSVFAAETIEHTYPFCYRCETPLLYYAVSTWFIKVTAIKPELLKTAKSINWVPDHVKNGRFGKWLEGARDWAISRNRYWGAPMPVWVNIDDDTDYIVIESIEELKKLSGVKDITDLHRPFIDDVVINKDGKTYKRVEEVLDCWVESGSMAYAQNHYPFENKNKFAKTFPADYIGEGLDQTRLWFYVLHVLSTTVFNKPAYKNVVVNSMLLASDGQKLSKRLRNYPPIEEVFAQEGADALRLYLLSSYQSFTADYMRFNRDDMKELSRNVLGTLWNTFKFFKMYADVDKWQASAKLTEPKSSNILDRWILSRLNETIVEATKQGDKYQIAHAINPVFNLIDDLSNWYVRRSRRRFWKSEDDSDKAQAYVTLHYVLVRVTQLLAPWAPFLTDKIYRELRSKSMPESVHLTDWPEAGKADKKLIEMMAQARDIVTEGLKQRADAGIKVRQPLAAVEIPELDEAYEDIVKDELNVKDVIHGKTAKIDTEITQPLKLEGLAREVVRHVQQYRKEVGLNVDDRIHLELETEGELKEAIQAFGDLISAETLAKKLDYKITIKASKPVDVDGIKLTIGISKV